jgi:hypothetical protein
MFCGTASLLHVILYLVFTSARRSIFLLNIAPMQSQQNYFNEPLFAFELAWKEFLCLSILMAWFHFLCHRVSTRTNLTYHLCDLIFSASIWFRYPLPHEPSFNSPETFRVSVCTRRASLRTTSRLPPTCLNCMIISMHTGFLTHTAIIIKPTRLKFVFRFQNIDFFQICFFVWCHLFYYKIVPFYFC